ncbi:hybrid sensor histidine kinase/response regulator transcription factor [Paenibacillus sp. ACRRX]|uniref:helix-turn-helix transcriptional regulator n=1 Tax=Paenibacillus sp. ACRRX TaxID=2918206 RepID=UPI001EF5E55D|nr:hybrid sensor histidine kinase/response regulator transcription factor [Paenibacillus sp. ACRRX]MCG7409930.1 hybrid sensor histidine kinase/response regulator transcription factor [Paenibacillus sp. ACRRX]
MKQTRIKLPDRIIQNRSWQWIDWALYGLFLLWVISGFVYVYVLTDMIAPPKWPSIGLYILSVAVPFLFWRPGKIQAERFIASEIICFGGINILMHVSMMNYIDNMVLVALTAGFLSTTSSVRWSGPIVILFPFIGIWSGKLSVLQSMDQMMNHLILFGIGIGFNMLLFSQERLQQLLAHNHQQYRVIQQYAAQVEQLTVQEERSRMAAELHDTVGHAHVSLLMGLETVKSAIVTDVMLAQERLDVILDHARLNFSSIRSHIHGIAGHDEEIDLETSIRRLGDDMVAQTGLHVHLRITGEQVVLASAHQNLLLRCAQEAMTNAVKHGRATHIHCLLEYGERELQMILRDNGQGVEEVRFGFGLTAMRDRLQAYGGQLRVESCLDQGTTLACTLPLLSQVKQGSTIRILIADDEQLIRESLHYLCEQEQDIQVVATATDGVHVVEQVHHMAASIPNLSEAQVPNFLDVVLMDVRMPRMDGLACTVAIKEYYPQVKVLLLTTLDEIDSAAQAIEAGAEGYLLKSIHPKELLASLRLVYNGGTLLSPDLASSMMQELRELRANKQQFQYDYAPDAAVDPYGLTEREREVLDSLAEGLKYRQIAERLFLSEGTIRNYISSLYAKLGVSDRQSAANAGRDARLIRKIKL